MLCPVEDKIAFLTSAGPFLGNLISPDQRLCDLFWLLPNAMAANNLSEPAFTSSMLCYSYEDSWDRCLEKGILTLWKGKVQVLRSLFFFLLL